MIPLRNRLRKGWGRFHHHEMEPGMTAMHVPFEIFELLERRLGREDGMQGARSIETSMSHVVERSKKSPVSASWR